MITIGRICMKTAGREAGRLCCVVKTLEGGMVLVTGPPQLTQVRRRKCNIAHLEPLAETLDIAADASDAEVLKAFQSSPVLGQLKPLSAEELKKRAQWKEQKAKARALREAEARKLKEALQKKQDEERKKAEAERAKKAKAAKPAKSPKPDKAPKDSSPAPAQPAAPHPPQPPAQPLAPA